MRVMLNLMMYLDEYTYGVNGQLPSERSRNDY